MNESIYTGSILTGSEIKKQIELGNIEIDPYDESCINPNSYNVKLHPQLAIYNRNRSRDGKSEIILPIQEEFLNKLRIVNTLYHDREIDYSEYANRAEALAKEYADADTELKEKYGISIYGSRAPYKKNYRTMAISSVLSGEIYDDDEYYNKTALDMKSKNDLITFDIPENGYVLRPGVLYLGRTIERTKTDKFIPMIDGRSSIGRLGIWIHVSAGFGDVGFDGTWTLEITAIEPVRIYPNVEIGQVCFHKPYGDIENLYRGRYYKQEDATESRFYLGKGYTNNDENQPD